MPDRLPAPTRSASLAERPTAQPLAAHLPAELALRIARHLWPTHLALAPGARRGLLGVDMGSRLAHVARRRPALLGVCRAWRRALYGEFSRVVFGDCQLGSGMAPLAFLHPATTREVWLRFDGALLFGSRAVEWARSVLARGHCGLAVDSLLLVIYGPCGSATTAIEDARGQQLAEECRRALQPRQIRFLEQPIADSTLVSNWPLGTGDKFARLYAHLALSTLPPPLVSIDCYEIGCASACQLVARSACSLEYLRIGRVGPSQLQALVFGMAGGLVFMRLRELYITLDLDEYGAPLRALSIAGPHFPGLEALRVNMPAGGVSAQRETRLSIFEHSFLVDLLLHGSARLRRLTFPLAWDTVELLTPQLLSQVRQLVLYEISMEGEHVLDNSESGQMLASILSLRLVRSVHLNSAAQSISLPAGIECAMLQTLRIPLVSLDVSQLSELLRHTPALLLLHCRLVPKPTAGDYMAGTRQEMSLLADDVVYEPSEYYSGRSLQALAVDVHSANFTAVLAQLAVLAVVQPRLQRVFIPALLAAPLGKAYLHAAKRAMPKPWRMLRLFDIDTEGVY